MSSDLATEAREWRHHLHSDPETGFQEHRTAAFVAGLLAEWGLEVTSGVGGTGVVATLARGAGGGRVGLRADMDALAITEREGRAHGSRTTGAMHACGHDGHMTMLLAAARTLSRDGGFSGTVHFVFQPAEEHGRGAKAMLDDDLLERFPMDAIYGVHNMPGIPAGDIHVRAGAIMASEDNFEIVITGRGGHAARPHMVVDPLVIGAEIVLALQSVVARNVDPQASAVVSCTEFVTDGLRNAIPGEVVIRGDTRSFDPAVQGLLADRMRAICEGIASAHGAACSFSYTHEFEPTVNDPSATRTAIEAAQTAVGADRVDADCAPVMASEDFGAFLRVLPGCFAFLGNGAQGEPGGVPLHSRDYDFNDDVIDAGARYFVSLVRMSLPSDSPKGRP